MAEREQQSPQQVRGKRKLRWTVGILAFVILVPSAIGFTKKLMEFIRTSSQDHEGGFAILPLLVYLAVAGGFLCLLVWAVFEGMFRDIERPKYTMLENENRLEEREHALR